jgi:hypothetical protein
LLRSLRADRFLKLAYFVVARDEKHVSLLLLSTARGAIRGN